MTQITLFLTWVLYSVGILAQFSPSAIGQQYKAIAGFPAYNVGCRPINYVSTSDLGNTNPSDAQSRCQQQCSNLGTSCDGVIILLNKGANSGSYSGTCFHFASGNTPVSPRRCANPVDLLQGYVKDNTLPRFSNMTMGTAAACPSLSSSTITSTVTITPRTSTLSTTSTITANFNLTTSTTSTISATATLTANKTVTANTTVGTTTITLITSVTTFNTSTATEISSTTVTVTAGTTHVPRDVPGYPFAAPPAYSTSKSLYAPGLSISSCSSAGTVTTTKTVTAATPLTTVTVSTTVTKTMPVTFSTNTTVTSSTMTVTSSITTILNLTATTSTTATQFIESDIITTTTVVQTSTFTATPLQTVILTVNNSQDPSLTSSGGVGYSSFESYQGSDTVYYMDFTTDSSSQQKFTLNSVTGELKALNGPGNSAGESCYYGYYPPSASYGLFLTADSAAGDGDRLFVCRNLSGKLQCQYGDQSAVFWTCASRLCLADPTYDLTNQCSGADTSYKVDVYVSLV